MTSESRRSVDVEDATAQDVIDALRFVLMSQKDPTEVVRLVNVMLECAPETDGDRGLDFLLGMIVEGSLKVALTDAA
jgi:hypothetical protein